MNIEANKTIGRCLQRLRIDAGTTQSQLANELHKPQSYVSKSKWENEAYRYTNYSITPKPSIFPLRN